MTKKPGLHPLPLLRCPCRVDGGDEEKCYPDCCGRYIDNREAVPTAEALMRSRYTAYTLSREDYLLITWHRSTRPHSLDLPNAPSRQWLGLKVRRHEQRGPDEATVEFVARYKVGGRAHRLREISQFLREAGRWFYVTGDILVAENTSIAEHAQCSPLRIRPDLI
jgi:SEC-C motif-containing protein